MTMPDLTDADLAVLSKDEYELHSLIVAARSGQHDAAYLVAAVLVRLPDVMASLVALRRLEAAVRRQEYEMVPKLSVATALDALEQLREE